MNDFSTWNGNGKVVDIITPYHEEKQMYFVIASTEKDKDILRGVYAEKEAKEKIKHLKKGDNVLIVGAASRYSNNNLFIKASLKEQIHLEKKSVSSDENISLWSGSGKVLQIKQSFTEDKDMYFIFQSEIDRRKVERGIFVKDVAKQELKELEEGDRLTLLNVKETLVDDNIFILLEHKEQLHQQPKIIITADEYFARKGEQ